MFEIAEQFEFCFKISENNFRKCKGNEENTKLFWKFKKKKFKYYE